ncbi:MAG TPA: hypothetical protein VFF48_03765 [Brevundimonas sp.]|nr:hypothetical protein [Brevundimonas sp.]
MFRRIVTVATLALLLAACMPSTGGGGLLGTWGQRTGDHPALAGAVITRVDASTSAGPGGGCTAAPTGVCGGCTAVCPPSRPARCESGVTRFAAPDSGRAPSCVREAVCACG